MSRLHTALCSGLRELHSRHSQAHWKLGCQLEQCKPESHPARKACRPLAENATEGKQSRKQSQPLLKNGFLFITLIFFKNTFLYNRTPRKYLQPSSNKIEQQLNISENKMGFSIKYIC